MSAPVSEPVVVNADPATGVATRPAKGRWLAEVLRTERLTPQMMRVTFGGAGLSEFAVGVPTDSYVKLHFVPRDAPYGVPYNADEIKRDLSPEWWPIMRTYTVRSWDAGTGELAIDFVVHGDEGVAAPWALHAAVGDQIYVTGPGGAYAPNPAADWHLFVGDDSALPAIAAGLESLVSGSRALAVIEVGSPADEQRIASAADVEFIWLHRDDPAGPPDIAATVRELRFLPGQVHAFVHGDAGFVRELRRYLRVEKSVAREFLSISGYWKRGLAEDGWRTAKQSWAQPVDDAEAQLER
ncbi:siderophore-interacting protein [Leifsonia sp. YAF41]|uniref:siderophore-interacting protein n=1 Tax=Leifsonia sp. YAF41 TaxID=3233086 RepID=UPI003F98152A